MLDDRDSIRELLQELDKTDEVIEVLERASQELREIIDLDEAVRQNPWRRRQLQSIREHLASARAKRMSLTLMTERLQARAFVGAEGAKIEGEHPQSLATANHAAVRL